MAEAPAQADTTWENDKSQDWFSFFRLPRLDLPLARDDANRFLPWIVAFMVFLAALTVLLSLTLNQSLSAGSRTYADRFTIQIPSGEAAEEQAQVALEEIRNVAGVQQAEIISKDEMLALLAPWLGSGEGALALPLPVLIEGRITPDQSLDWESLQQLLQKTAPGAEVDDYADWVNKFSQLAKSLQWTAYGLAALILLVMAAIIIFATKTALKIHTRAVLLLHSIGAVDAYVARQFQNNAFLLGMKGGLLGTFAAVGAYALLAAALKGFDAPLLPQLDFTAAHWLMMIVMPWATGLLAAFSARLTVLGILKKIL